MPASAKSRENLIETVKKLGQIRLAVMDAAQSPAVEMLSKAQQLRIVKPRRSASRQKLGLSGEGRWRIAADRTVPRELACTAAAKAVKLVRKGEGQGRGRHDHARGVAIPTS
jgi:hypothetical protein